MRYINTFLEVKKKKFGSEKKCHSLFFVSGPPKRHRLSEDATLVDEHAERYQDGLDMDNAIHAIVGAERHSSTKEKRITHLCLYFSQTVILLSCLCF